MQMLARQGWKKRAGRGALAGAWATAAMSLFMAAARRAHWLGSSPPRKLTERFLRALGLSPPRRHRSAMTAVNHLAFGAAAGIPFTLLFARPDKRMVRVLVGGAYGLVVWTIMYQGILPALGLMPPPRRDRPGRPTSMALAHVIYGAALGFVSGSRKAGEPSVRYPRV